MKVILKSRFEMNKEFKKDRYNLGWWHDVCPGDELEVRQATRADLARCKLDDRSSKNPRDYYCEDFENGSLINKRAVKFVENV